MKTLYIIPARGGSKGLPGKNIKKLNNKPLIHFSIEFAREFAKDKDICVSTDSDDIIKCANEIGLEVPFIRPHKLSTDTATSYDVIMHALNHYKEINRCYDLVVLLQPTTPFRRASDLRAMISDWDESLDMLVSVKETKESPYFNVFDENEQGYLTKVIDSKYNRRQDAPKVYTINGSIYLLKVSSLLKQDITDFKFVKKYLMNDIVYSIDIDSIFDWYLCQMIVDKNMI